MNSYQVIKCILWHYLIQQVKAGKKITLNNHRWLSNPRTSKGGFFQIDSREFYILTAPVVAVCLSL